MKLKHKFVPIMACLSLASPCAISSMCMTGCSISSQLMQEQKIYSVLDSNLMPETESVISFFKTHKAIPYISLKEAFKLIKYERAKYFTDDLYDVTITDVDGLTIVEREKNNGAKLFIDHYTNTMTFDDFGKFITQGVAITESYVRNAGVIQNYDSDNVNYIAYGKTKNRIKEINTKTFNLGSYGIDIVRCKGETYLPFATVSDIFLGDVYRPLAALNGVIVCMYEQHNPDKVDQKLKDYAVEPTKELLKFNYNETCFFLDTFYGFKQKRGYPSFDQLLTANGCKDKMLSDVTGVDEAVNFYIEKIFDDGHSRYCYPSPSDPEPYNRTPGPSRSKIGDELSYYTELRSQAYTKNNPLKEYDEIDSTGGENPADTAIITFDMFTELPKSKDWYTTPPTSLEDVKIDGQVDAIGLFIYSYKKISENPNIKNVIVDLSCNRGGDERALAFTSAMICGGEVTTSYKNIVDGSTNTCSFCADANLDHKIDSKDCLLKDKHVYVLASPFSFSCANAMPLFTYDSDNVQLVGKRSGGGACVVLPAVNAFGTSYQTSGIYELGKLVNGSFYDGDKGIDPVFNIDSSIYYTNNRVDLVNYIKSQQH